MAEVPPIADAAVVGAQRAIVAPVAPGVSAGLASTEEDGLRGAAALDQREVAIDELPVDDAHAGIVGAGRDSYRSRRNPPMCPGLTVSVTPAADADSCIIPSAAGLGSP